MKDRLEWLDRHQDIILDVVSKASIDDNSIDTYCEDLKLIVEITTKRICDLRQAKVRQELLWSRFKKTISANPGIGSRYEVAFSEIDAFIRWADTAIQNLLKGNVEWCYIMSLINGNSHCFRRTGPVLLDTSSNSKILHDPENLLVDDFLTDNLQFMKQCSDLWMEFWKGFQLTGSTMYNTLGLRTLKDQKLHVRKYVKKEEIPQEPIPAMEHRTNHEVCTMHVLITCYN